MCITVTPNSATAANCHRYRGNTSEVSIDFLEGCLNESLWNGYKLKTKVTNYDCQSVYERHIDIDVTDIMVTIMLFLILMVNAIGSLNEIYVTTEKKCKGKFFQFFF